MRPSSGSKLPLRCALVLVSALLWVACGSGTDASSLRGGANCRGDDCPRAGECELAGVIYADGSRNIPAEDGCNSCECDDGDLICTEKACDGNNGGGSNGGGSSGSGNGGSGSVGSCELNGETYADGQEGIPAGDGCNTCSCAGGNIACTERACPDDGCVYAGERYENGQSFPSSDGCNTCSCEAGMVACTLRACPETTCMSTADCASAQWCVKRAGECSSIGICQAGPVPDPCAAIYAPVCGCNNVTYSNKCVATGAGINIASEGACDDTPGCRNDADCADNEYCARPIGQCAENGTSAGQCTSRPRACSREFDPMCGCNGVSYSNPCSAAAAGVNLRHEGACGDISMNHCYSNADCAATDTKRYCAFADGMCSGIIMPLPGGIDPTIPAPLQAGECRAAPNGCDLRYAPVCGCDGKTYGNRCSAAQAGVSVWYATACR